jgi:uncharacterized protein (DUF58 family)
MAVPENVKEGAVRGALTEAKGLAAGLPDLLIEARRVAATIIAGWHGRRAAGRGETFWQFRPFMSGDTTAGIDWRRSARDDHFYVREKEWEAAHTVWLWLDLSASMIFRSRLATVSKRDRGMVFLLALAELLASAGERVGLLGESDPMLARNAAERVARFLARAKPSEPATRALRRFSDVVLIGDFLDPIADIEAVLDRIRSRRPSPSPDARSSRIPRPGFATSSAAPSSIGRTTTRASPRSATGFHCSAAGSIGRF